jgi:hypothetical protein
MQAIDEPRPQQGFARAARAKLRAPPGASGRLCAGDTDVVGVIDAGAGRS